jgi:hypothetical protein
MYDTSFDHRGAELPRSDRRVLWAVRILAVLAVVVAASAGAQMPGAPLLQNVWSTPGSVAALNVGGGGGWTVYAGAVSWAPGFGHVQLSGGAGFANGIGTGTHGAYGLRVAAPFGGDSTTLGFAAFAGVGGGSSQHTYTPVSCTLVIPNCLVVTPTVARSGLVIFDTTTSSTVIPIGASIGWRRGIGASQGVSVYASPAFVYYAGGTHSDGLMRVGIGVDGGISSTLGITGGFEFGGTRSKALGGPSGVVYGLGVAYAFGRR